MNRLKVLIQEAFENAKENGIYFDEWTDEEITYDMINYDSEIQEYPFDSIKQLVGLLR